MCSVDKQGIFLYRIAHSDYTTPETQNLIIISKKKTILNCHASNLPNKILSFDRAKYIYFLLETKEFMK